MAKRKDTPTILCRVEGRELYAKAEYWFKDRFIIGIYFWSRGKWIEPWDMKLPRPLTIVAVPKILGKENVRFYLLTKGDISAPRPGGYIHREPHMLDRSAMLRKDLKGIIRVKPRERYAGSLVARKKARASKFPGVKFGRPKHMEKINLSDYLKHPIWVPAHDEERYDEEWYKPVVSPSEVSKAVLNVDHPVILFKVEETGGYGCGYYDHRKTELYGLCFLLGGKWKIIEEVGPHKTPLRLTAIPKIMGKEAEFILQNQKTGRAKKAPCPFARG
jgi:hypothetical protein